MKKQDKGFTLVELLIVIVILGILATVTVFAVRGISNRGQDSACATDLRTMQTAVEAWYAQENTAPTEEQLISRGFLAGQSANYNLEAGDPVTVVPVADGPCGGEETTTTDGGTGT